MTILIGTGIILAGIALLALACIGLWHVTEPQETVAAKRAYHHNGAVRWSHIVKR